MWISGLVIHNEIEHPVMIKGDQYQFPASAGVGIGDVITVGSKSYRVVALSHFRDEALIAKVEEVKDGKSTSRRTRSNASG